MQTERRKKELVLFFFFKHRRTIRLGDTTAPGYSEPLQTLNGELVLIAPYGVERSSNRRRS